MGLFSKLFAPKRAVLSNSFVKMPIFHQTLAFPLPDSWSVEPSMRMLEEGRFVLEFLGEGESEQAWRNKLIIQGFNNANDDVELTARKLLRMMKEEMASIDEQAFYSEELYSETTLSRQRLAVVMGLKRLPHERTQSQFGLYLIIEGEHDIYIIQRAWKGEPDKNGFLVPKAELHAWLEEFKLISLGRNGAPVA